MLDNLLDQLAWWADSCPKGGHIDLQVTIFGNPTATVELLLLWAAEWRHPKKKKNALWSRLVLQKIRWSCQSKKFMTSWHSAKSGIEIFTAYYSPGHPKKASGSFAYGLVNASGGPRRCLKAQRPLGFCPGAKGEAKRRLGFPLLCAKRDPSRNEVTSVRGLVAGLAKVALKRLAWGKDLVALLLGLDYCIRAWQPKKIHQVLYMAPREGGSPAWQATVPLVHRDTLSTSTNQSNDDLLKGLFIKNTRKNEIPSHE